MNKLSGSTLVEALDQLVEQHHLLGHPFYRAWNDGTLELESLRLYGAQYYKHVAAFPDHLAQLAARTDGQLHDLVADNLAEEINPEAPHPQLWRDFAAAIGVSGDDIDTAEALPGIAALVDTYGDIAANASAAGAVAAFYAYESQMPEISTAKIDGLKAHYGITEGSGLDYFAAHREADECHRAQWRGWLEGQDHLDADEVLDAARRGLMALWGALDACHSEAATRH